MTSVGPIVWAWVSLGSLSPTSKRQGLWMNPSSRAESRDGATSRNRPAGFWNVSFANHSLCNLDNLQNLKSYSHTISWGILHSLRIVAICMMGRTCHSSICQHHSFGNAIHLFVVFIHSFIPHIFFCVPGLAGVRADEKASDLAWSDGGDRHVRKGQDTAC